MKRRSFIKHTSKTALLGSALGLPTNVLSNFFPKSSSSKFEVNPTLNKDLIIGHGNFKYKVDYNWGKLDAIKHPIKDAHEMVIDKKGRIYLLTNHTKNNILVYSQKGKLINSWGTEYPGAHGLTICDEGGEEFLYICDNDRHELIKTDLNGKVILTLGYPKDAKEYKNKEAYIPTESAVASNGDIYVVDGYGSQYVMQYSSKGILKNIFGGKGTGQSQFLNAHGIAIDKRDGVEKLLVTCRSMNKLKYFTLDGIFISEINLPGAYICRPVIHQKNIYLATIWSGNGESNTGFISILNEENKLESAPGGSKPVYEGGELQSMHQRFKLFKHPHDVCVDPDENLYVAQWNANGIYPIKLIRV